MEDEFAGLEAIEVPGQDGSPMEVDPSEYRPEMRGEFDYMPNSGEVPNFDEEAELPPQPEELYLGRFKSPQEMADYIRQVEGNQEQARFNVTPEDYIRYGVDLNRIDASERQQFNDLCQKHLGVTLEAAAARLIRGEKAFEAYSQEAQKKQVDSYQQELRQEWGGDYDHIMGEVRKIYNSLSDQEKPAYNTVRGAKALGAQVRLAMLQNKRAATPVVPAAKTQPMLRSSVPSKQLKSSAASYSLASIEAKALADPAWYARNERAIGELHAKGLIK